MESFVPKISWQAYAEILTNDDNCGSMEAEHSTGLGENVFVCAHPIDDRNECFSPGAAMDYFCEFHPRGLQPPPVLPSKRTGIKTMAP